MSLENLVTEYLNTLNHMEAKNFQSYEDAFNAIEEADERLNDIKQHLLENGYVENSIDGSLMKGEYH